MSEKNKKDDWDNGMTVAPMNGDELPKYRRMAYLNRPKKVSKEEKQELRNRYTKKEKKAIVRAGIVTILPRLFIVIGAFAIVAVLMYLWLK